MILVPTNRRIIRPGDKPSFEHTQRYGLIKDHPLGPAGGLIFFPIMNEGSGTTVRDLSGNRNIGKLTGTAPSWTSGKFGSAVLLPAADEYLGSLNRVDFTAGTIRIVMKPANAAGAAVEHFFSAQQDTTNRVSLQNYNDGNTYWGWKINNVWFRFIVADAWPSEWIDIAFTWNSNTGHYELYWNGISKASADNLPSKPNCDEPPYIGANNNEGIAGSFSDISVDNATIYNRDLSADEIASVYWNPFCMVEKKAAPVYFFVPIAAVPPGGLSNVTELQLLEHLVGKTPFSKPTAYIGFCSADPGEDATGISCNEVADANGYERIATAMGDWGNASTGAIENAVALASPYATGSWGEITHFVLVDSPTYGEGEVLAYDALDTPKTIEDKDNLEFAIGDLAFTLN